MSRYFPKTKNLSITADRFQIIYQSPRFGTCIAGYCCDVCDGKIRSGFIYTKEEADLISQNLIENDAMGRVWVGKPLEAE